MIPLEICGQCRFTAASGVGRSRTERGRRGGKVMVYHKPTRPRGGRVGEFWMVETKKRRMETCMQEEGGGCQVKWGRVI